MCILSETEGLLIFFRVLCQRTKNCKKKSISFSRPELENFMLKEIFLIEARHVTVLTRFENGVCPIVMTDWYESNATQVNNGR